MDSQHASRRTVLKRFGVVAVGVLTALGAGSLGTRPAAALVFEDEFVAEDISIERNDSSISAVTVAPDIELRWRDFGGGIDAVDVTLSAAIDGDAGFDVLLDTSVESDSIAVAGDRFDTAAGTAELTTDRLDLTEIGSNVTTDDFGGALDPGQSRTTTVELVLRVDLMGVQDETVTALETTTFDVTVHNPEGSASTVARANAAVE